MLTMKQSHLHNLFDSHSFLTVAYYLKFVTEKKNCTDILQYLLALNLKGLTLGVKIGPSISKRA